MEHAGQEGDCHVFEATHGPCLQSGQLGYTVRVLPFHRDLTSPFLPGYITWA
jgi:hypothetical protein